MADKDRVLTIVEFDDDQDTAVASTYDLDGVDLDALKALIGEPRMVEIVTPEQILARQALQRGPYIER